MQKIKIQVKPKSDLKDIRVIQKMIFAPVSVNFKSWHEWTKYESGKIGVNVSLILSN